MQAEVNVPEFAKISMNIQTDTISQPMPIPMDDVRHVIALDLENETKDHIVQHAYAAGPFLERPSYSKLPRYSRYVSGLDIEIPWPTETEPHAEVGEFDTRGNSVTDVTWVPSMDEPPFPSTVIDELRNKYSRFRTRHDEDYVRKMVLKEYQQEYLKSQTLLSPRNEFLRQRALESAAKKEAELDENGNVAMNDDTKDFINQFMKLQTKASKSAAQKSA